MSGSLGDRGTRARSSGAITARASTACRADASGVPGMPCAAMWRAISPA
jgi:hypothetical protein